ncbi:MAG: hypothetical protein LC808_28455, partial [Actinobacteria bacterium]|nr:hypothetical protein [Actinomycetota bacterium]
WMDVLDGNLELIHRTDQEVVLKEPEWGVSITLEVPVAVPRETLEESSTMEVVRGLRVVPDYVNLALGDHVILLAEPLGDQGVPMGGVRIAWQANDADGEAVPISSSGEFVGRKPGEHQVVASARDQEAKATVIVADHPLAAPATQIAAMLPQQDGDGDGDGDGGPKWNNGNAASACTSGNQVGDPAGALMDGIRLGRSSLRARDELREAVAVGNANYTFSAPVVNLPGRGLDLRLNLTYNSRLWNRSRNEVEFDVDKGWPAPGWSLGFGRMVRLGSQGSMLVSPDGTRHPYEILVQKGNMDYHIEFEGRTTDGTFIDYRHLDDWRPGWLQEGQARYPDGTTVDYTARGKDYRAGGSSGLSPSWGVLFPTRITDANGNMIVIAYRNNRGPQIDTIVDTLGRTISFHYDSLGQLTAINGPGLDGSRRTFVHLNIVSLRLNYAFAADLKPVRDTKSMQAVSAIYYPGTADGYWFGDQGTYSGYGMATQISQHRGMGLTESGLITPGYKKRQRTYNYPLTADPGLTDVPTYTTMTEDWEWSNTDPAVTRYTVRSEGDRHRIEVIRPDGARTVEIIYNRPGEYDDGMLSQREVYDGRRLLRLTTNRWQQGDYRSPRLARVETTMKLNSSDSPMSATEYDYGPHNRVTEVRELDFGGVALMRRTRMEYEGAPGYAERHIFSLPTAIEVFDRYESRPDKRTEFVYDNQLLRDAPGVVGHAQTHNPYSPGVWAPPHETKACDPDRKPPCWITHHPGYREKMYQETTRFRGNVTEIRRYADPVQRGRLRLRNRAARLNHRPKRTPDRSVLRSCNAAHTARDVAGGCEDNLRLR